jgi:ribosomal protein S17E
LSHCDGNFSQDGCVLLPSLLLFRRAFVEGQASVAVPDQHDSGFWIEKFEENERIFVNVTDILSKKWQNMIRKYTGTQKG